MAISSPNVMQGQSIGSNELFALGQAFQQQAQMNQQDEQFQLDLAEKKRQFDEANQIAATKYQQEVALASEENRIKGLEKKWETYKNLDINDLAKSQNTFQQIFNLGLELGYFDEESTAEDVLTTFGYTPEQKVAREKLETTQAHHEDDLALGWASLGLSQRRLEMDIANQANNLENAPLQLRRDFELTNNIVKELMATPTAEREDLIKERGWDQWLIDYNKRIAGNEFGLEPINIETIDTGDWNPFTARERAVNIKTGAPAPAVAPQYSDSAISAWQNQVISGDNTNLDKLEQANAVPNTVGAAEYNLDRLAQEKAKTRQAYNQILQ